MESSREDQIMEAFNELLSSYYFIAKGRIENSGDEVDARLAHLESRIDDRRGHMTRLVYGKGADTE